MIARLKILLEEPRGAAWPSSARGANCQVKSCNERDPHALLLISSADEMHTAWTARVKWEEGATVGQYGLNLSGLHVAYNAYDNGLLLRKEMLIPQT